MPRALRWQKSSYSAGTDDTNCLEIAAAPTLHLRESDEPATLLTPAPAALNALLTALKGQFRV
ncbi:DUF397 domain-containing protein [Streptomyces sp. MBT62]|uniref:DUF397 domain-containing protein n=1 Tax=Streptomyces sp. MBT62 TaxID=2800410 RepID=UPI00190DBFE7|nr:DUF397 domain-containing protein [Streptomyces sp. MBT62]MBK3566918.1 DUF397 domain-containing protein [Streptomyces sp. MBT62]